MMITLYKPDDQGRIHYYSLNDRQTHLFAAYTITINWGLAPSSGRQRTYAFDSRREMDRKLQQLIQRKVDAGYRVLYSFFRNQEYRYLRPALRKAAVS
jgi:predicted DNA-binding WGR domain protein